MGKKVPGPVSNSPSVKRNAKECGKGDFIPSLLFYKMLGNFIERL
jgi:hypothetical protein